MIIRKHPSHYICLNQGFRADLSWWHMFLSQWNGISMMSAIGISSPSFTLTSDASSSWGYGAHFASHWFQIKWDPLSSAHSIAFLELVLIVVVGMVWGKLWKGSHVCCQCDNQAAVAIIQSRYSRDDKLIHLLRCLFVEAYFNFSFTLADALSQNHNSSLLQALSMDLHPTPVQPEIPKFYSTHRWTGYPRFGHTCSVLFKQSLSPSTYATDINHFHKFCVSNNISNPFLFSQSLLLLLRT